MSKKAILVIEDDFDIRQAVAELLENEGFSVSEAGDGQQGMDTLRKGSLPDLILLDLMMPIKDGFRFREEQINDPKFAQIPVVIMTAGDPFGAKKRELGVKAFLRKPLDIDEAIATIRKHLP